MYLSYYKLRKEPFHITPDPAFLFLSPGHKEALGAIIYGTEQRKGFVAVTGEVGTGKTTVIRSYLERIDRNRVRPIYIFNANVSFKELLSTIFMELGLEPGSDNVYSMVHRLQQVLIEEFRADRNVVLVIDEAQNMPVKTLEQLRMLSNLETTEDKLIQIVLAGQPELEAKLNLPELRQLRQRIAFRATIHPLSNKESHDYIQFRLEKVSQSREALFSKTALRRIVDYAHGSPRVINILCDNALIAGFGMQVRPITAQIVKQVIRDYAGRTRPRWARLLRYAAAALVLLGFGGLLVSPYGEGLREEMGRAVAQARAAWPLGMPEPAPAPAGQPEALPLPPQPTPPVENAGNRAALGDVVLARVAAPPSAPVVVAPMAATPTPAPQPVQAPPENETPAPPGETEPLADLDEATPEMPLAPPVPVTLAPPPSTLAPAPAPRAEAAPPAAVPPVLAFREPTPAPVTHFRAQTRVVRQGDFLSRLCVEVYGFSSGELLEMVREANPQIADPNRIMVGDIIRFPDLRLAPQAPVEIGGK